MTKIQKSQTEDQFWSLGIGICNLFDIWNLEFGALRLISPIYLDVNSSSPLRLILSSAPRTLSGSAGA